MNVDKNKILYLSFNQDQTCINMGTTEGFVIYSLDPFKIKYEHKFGKGIGIAEIYLTSNVIGLVGGGDDPKYPTNKLVIWDDYQEKEIGEVDSGHRIVGVKFNKEHFAVVCNNSVKLYHLRTMQFVLKVDTYDNRVGVCSLSATPTSPILVTPGIKPGYVNIVNYETGITKTFKCHDNPIHNICLNADSTKIATAGNLGTLIRIHDVATQTKFRELRRGSDSCDIHNIHFSKDSKCLVVTSSKNTIHVFSLCKEYKNTKSSLKPLGLGLFNKFFNSEWSLFSIPWKLTPTDDSDIDNKSNIDNKYSKHISSIPICDEKEETYKMFTIGHNGKYISHQFQFNPAKLEKLKSGNLFEIEKMTQKDVK